MRTYGQWAGNPKGNKENTERCVVEIYNKFYGFQCQRKRGHGKNGLLCKQHAKMEAKGRRLNIPRNKEKP